MLFLLAFSIFSGCSSSSDDNGEQGEVTVSLTDAEGDFVTYSVDVLSIKLTKKNGLEVETLPVTTTVDFTQYVDMTEFLTAASVPLGAYSKATMVLDYSNADIRVENTAGETVQVTSIKDADNNDVTTMEVSVYLENQSALVIAPGLISHITLDFDLKVSNTVSFDGAGAASVVVEPSLVVDIDKESPKAHRVRGLLGDINEDMNYFYVKLCPFFHELKGKKAKFGEVMVLSGSETVYEINGLDFVGAEGLAALTDIDEDTPVLVKGKMLFNPRRFEADEVYVGTSVPGVSGDMVTGNVLKREGNVLSVNGLVISEEGKEIRLNDTVEVTLSEDTVVKKQLSTEEFAIGDIAPGQKILVTGVLSELESGTLALDATLGTARLLMTSLRGNVAADTESSDLNVKLDSIDMRKTELFDFTGTGTSAENDADPLSYEIETADLDTSGFGFDDPIKIFGFVNAFGQAPYDFAATSIVDYSNLPTFFTLRWFPSTTEPFVELTEESLVVDLDALNVYHILFKSHEYRVDDTGEVTINPSESGVFVIHMRKKPEVYTNFAEFSARLDILLDGNNRARRLFATGIYDRENQILTASYLTMDLK